MAATRRGRLSSSSDWFTYSKSPARPKGEVGVWPRITPALDSVDRHDPSILIAFSISGQDFIVLSPQLKTDIRYPLLGPSTSPKLLKHSQDFSAQFLLFRPACSRRPAQPDSSRAAARPSSNLLRLPTFSPGGHALAQTTLGGSEARIKALVDEERPLNDLAVHPVTCPTRAITLAPLSLVSRKRRVISYALDVMPPFVTFLALLNSRHEWTLDVVCCASPTLSSISCACPSTSTLRFLPNLHHVSHRLDA